MKKQTPTPTPTPAYRRGPYTRDISRPRREKISISLSQSAIGQADDMATVAACSRSRAIEFAIEFTAAKRQPVKPTGENPK